VQFRRYNAASSWVGSLVSEAERANLQEHASHFRKYADEFGFDWMLLAAQAHQESGMDQSRKSRSRRRFSSRRIRSHGRSSTGLCTNMVVGYAVDWITHGGRRRSRSIVYRWAGNEEA